MVKVKIPTLRLRSGQGFSRQGRARMGHPRVGKSKLVFLGGDDPGDNAVPAGRAGRDGTETGQWVPRIPSAAAGAADFLSRADGGIRAADRARLEYLG